MSAASEPQKPVWHMPQAMKQQLMKAFSELLEQPAEKLYMTYEEFLDWADEDTLAEWVNGEVIMTSPASDEHQDIVGFLDAVMRAFVESNHLGVIRIAPFQMRITTTGTATAPSNSGREPDVLFVAEAHRDRFKKTYLDGPADLVVEVISPESAGRDRGDKYFEYQEAGIPEYWLIDPRSRRAEFYQLDTTDGTYHVVPPDATGVYRTPIIPGFWLRVEWLWQLPPVMLAILQVSGANLAEFLIEELRKQGFLPEEQ